MLKFKHPWQPAFMPLVPEASSGRRGLFSQMSQAGHHLPRDMDIVIFDETRDSPPFQCFCSS